MASIVSTNRPINPNTNVSSSTGTDSNTTNNNVATNSLSSDIDTSQSLSATKKKITLASPQYQYQTPTRQQAIKPTDVDNRKATPVYENRYLVNQSNVPKTELTNNDRSDLSILSKWGEKLRANNASTNVTTYMDDPSTVPLLRRDTNGFFNVDYNSDGTYNVSTVGIKIPGTDKVVGNYTLGNMSWNPIKAYDVSMPMVNYLSNYNFYDTKNKIVQGTMALAHSYSNYSDGHDNLVDDYAIKEWGNLVDMSINWGSRNAMQNTVAGLSTITGLSQRYGFNDYLGGDKAVGGVQNLLALYNFGNSVYNLGKNWSGMSSGEKLGATLSTVNSGIIAYNAGKPLFSSTYDAIANYMTNATANATANAVNTGVSNAVKTGVSNAVKTGASDLAKKKVVEQIGNTGEGTGASSMLGTIGTCVGIAASVYATYQYIDGFTQTNFGGADGRKAGAISGASAGAAIGSCICPGLGTAIGATIGAITGTLTGSIKHGKSIEQFKRDINKSMLSVSNIISKMDNSSRLYYQLADGQYFDVGKDGSGSRAEDINGTPKKFYNPSAIEDRDRNNVRDSYEMNPYDIDYTCNMDYTGSLLLAPLNALGLGGSNTKGSSEYSQTLGLLTNAVTSNVGREFTKDNYSKMLDNIKAGYERVGITDKESFMSAVGLSYMQGNLTEDDFNSFKLAADMLYDKSGYDRAYKLMEQLGRDQSQTEPIEASTDSSNEIKEDVVSATETVNTEPTPKEVSTTEITQETSNQVE